MKARDIASLQVTTIGPGTSVRHAARIMLAHGISGLPVVEDETRIVGIITEGDLIRRSELGLGKSQILELAGVDARAAQDYVKRHSWSVADVMTRQVISVDENESIAKVAELLEQHGIKRLPVTSDGKLIGLISRADLLRVIATTSPERIAAGDKAIHTSIVARLHEVFDVRSDHINVAVFEGNVRLSGEVASPDECDAARVIAENIQGVKCVENHLTFPSTA